MCLFVTAGIDYSHLSIPARVLTTSGSLLCFSVTTLHNGLETGSTHRYFYVISSATAYNGTVETVFSAPNVRVEIIDIDGELKIEVENNLIFVD